MTKQEFILTLNKLVETYNHKVRDSNEDIPIRQFLDSCGYIPFGAFNPSYLVEEIGKYDPASLDINGECTTRFKILIGLCEFVSYVNRPEEPSFRDGDILRGNTASKDIRYVKDYETPGLDVEYYYVEDIDGHMERFSREWMEDNYHKIGELTKRGVFTNL